MTADFIDALFKLFEKFKKKGYVNADLEEISPGLYKCGSDVRLAYSVVALKTRIKSRNKSKTKIYQEVKSL